MPGVVYHVLDINSDSIVTLSEVQVEDVEKRIRFYHTPAEFRGKTRDELLALGSMKIVDIINPDFQWD